MMKKETNLEIENIKKKIMQWENSTFLEKLKRKYPKPTSFEYRMLYEWIRR